MTDYAVLSTFVSPLINVLQARTVLIVGETAQNCYPNNSHAKPITLAKPFTLDQLATLETIDLAIISEVTETLSKSEALQWLGLLRNRYATHIIMISDHTLSAQQDWQLSDYLSLGMKHIHSHDEQQIFSYAIENYQFKKDWLNSRFWANPELYNKFRW